MVIEASLPWLLELELCPEPPGTNELPQQTQRPPGTPPGHLLLWAFFFNLHVRLNGKLFQFLLCGLLLLGIVLKLRPEFPFSLEQHFFLEKFVKLNVKNAEVFCQRSGASSSAGATGTQKTDPDGRSLP